MHVFYLSYQLAVKFQLNLPDLRRLSEPADTNAAPVQHPPAAGSIILAALERGVRSERALKLAIAEMYVQEISTRRVTQIMEERCGFEVSSDQVSRAAALLDEELMRWRTRIRGSLTGPFVADTLAEANAGTQREPQNGKSRLGGSSIRKIADPRS